MVPSRQTAMKTPAAASFDYLVGQCEQVGRYGQAEHLRCLRLSTISNRVACCTGKIGRLLQRIPLS